MPSFLAYPLEMIPYVLVTLLIALLFMNGHTPWLLSHLEMIQLKMRGDSL